MLKQKLNIKMETWRFKNKMNNVQQRKLKKKTLRKQNWNIAASGPKPLYLLLGNKDNSLILHIYTFFFFFFF